ncbi:MAG: universal stress protein [Acidobacteria bacterium]|nr:universal stress protein [Acidobacteriota bacterium]
MTIHLPQLIGEWRKAMKIVVGYDGSGPSGKALDDLAYAGLPATGVEALVISVAEVWMPPANQVNGNGFNKDDFPDSINDLVEKRQKIAENVIHEAELLSRYAKEKIAAEFPGWEVTAEATNGSPGWEILARANSFKPALIVVGSQGRNAFGRILLGSISHKILTEAKCSVRVARGNASGRPAADGKPRKIIVGFDGSMGSKIAVSEVASRNWNKGSEVSLVTAVQSLVPSTIGRFIPPVRDWVESDLGSEKEWMEKIADSSIKKLEDAGLRVKLEIEEGNPKEILVNKAAKWRADSIFVGAHSYSGMVERLLIGSTASAIAERAACSVEAVRSTE